MLVDERADGVVHVVLNRPERRNALNEPLMRRLNAVLIELESAPRCRAVVLAGNGKAFCAGGDLEDNIEPHTDAQSAAARHRLFLATADRLRLVPKPTVAAVHGAAVGAGASLALLCDEILVGTGAKLGFGFLQVGLPPDLLLAQTLQRRAGWTAAARLLHTGRMVPGAEAVGLGLAHELVEGPVLAAASVRAGELAKLSGPAFAATKTLLRHATCEPSGLADLEASLVGIAVMTHEFREATAGFRTG